MFAQKLLIYSSRYAIWKHICFLEIIWIEIIEACTRDIFCSQLKRPEALLLADSYYEKSVQFSSVWFTIHSWVSAFLSRYRLFVDYSSMSKAIRWAHLQLPQLPDRYSIAHTRQGGEQAVFGSASVAFPALVMDTWYCTFVNWSTERGVSDTAYQMLMQENSAGGNGSL